MKSFDKKALKSGLIAMLIALPFLAVAWFVVNFYLYFKAGGTFGGYGGTGDQDLKSWYDYASWAVSVVAILALFVIGGYFYKRSLLKSRRK